VLVALASGSLLPLGGATTTTPLVRYQIVVVPLALALDGRPGPVPFDVPGELVGSNGVTGENSYALTTGSLTLGTGGAFDYQFLLPGARWSRLELSLGSASGSTTGHSLISVSAYNHSTSRWDALYVKASSGELGARIPHPARYLGPGGALDVRIAAVHNGVEVYGAYPMLLASPPANLP
jgi:hypothetical protein